MTTLPPPSKRPRLTEDDSNPSLSCVLIYVVKNGAINHKELKELAVVSKGTSAAASMKDDEVWASLCHIFWPNTRDIPKSVIENKGYCWLYQSRISPMRSEPPPPRCTAEDLVLLIDVKVAKQSVSLSLTGSDLLPLLNESIMTIPLDEPLILGETRYIDNLAELYVHPEDWQYDESNIPVEEGHVYAVPSERVDDDVTIFEGTIFTSMNLLRSNDSTMAPLCEPNSHYLDHDSWRHPVVKAERHGNNYQVDWTFKQEKGYMTLGRSWEYLMLARSVDQYQIYMMLGGTLEILPGGKYAVTELNVRAQVDERVFRNYTESNTVRRFFICSRSCREAKANLARVIYVRVARAMPLFSIYSLGTLQKHHDTVNIFNSNSLLLDIYYK